jgi:hypothetical protein
MCFADVISIILFEHLNSLLYDFRINNRTFTSYLNDDIRTNRISNTNYTIHDIILMAPMSYYFQATSEINKWIVCFIDCSR